MGVTYYVGLDLAARNDYTALAVARAVWTLDEGPHELHVGYLDRWRGLPYPETVERVAGMLDRLDGHEMALDATGLGAPVADSFAARGVPFHAVTITAGSTARSSGNLHHVPKAALVASLVLLLEAGRLKVAAVPHADTLKDELKTFRLSTGATGRETYSHPSGGHDDLLMALALAAWLAETVAGGSYEVDETLAETIDLWDSRLDVRVGEPFPWEGGDPRW